MDEFSKGLEKPHGGYWVLFDQRSRGLILQLKGLYILTLCCYFDMALVIKLWSYEMKGSIVSLAHAH